MTTLPIKVLAIELDLARLRTLEDAVYAALPNAVFTGAPAHDAGMTQAAALDPDVILLGAGDDGPAARALCQRLKADPRLAAIPVLLLTTPATPVAERSAALAAGADGFLVSPFTAPEVVAQLRAMARLKAASRAQSTPANVAQQRRIRELEAALTEQQQAGAKLRADCAALDLILNTVPQSIFWKDSEGRYLGCNRVFATAAGLDDPAEIIGKTDFDLPWPLTEAEAYRADDCEVLTSGRPKLHILEPLQQADGSRLWIDTSKLPLIDATGRAYAVLGVYEDVTDRRKATRALDGFFDQPTNLHLIARLDGVIVRVNRGWENLLDYAKTDLEGNSFMQLVHPDDHAATLQELTRLAQGDATFYFENRYRHRDGSYRLLAWTALADLDENLLYAVAIDITARRQIEAELRASEEQFRTVFDVASVGIVQVDPSNGQLLRFNERYCQITGYSVDELQNIRFPELTHPDDREHDWQIFTAAVRGETPAYSNEKRYVRKDGSVIWVRLSAAFIHDADGRPYRTVAVCEDITGRKEAENALRESEERNRSLLERAPIGMAVHDGVMLLYINPAGAQLLGATSPAQLVGAPIKRFVRADMHRMMMERQQQLMHGDPLPPAEYTLLRLDGEPVDVEISSALMRFEGKDAVQITLRDITILKRAEAERAQLLAQVRAQAQQIRQILDTVPEGVLLIDQEQRVLFANPTGMRDLTVLAQAAVGDRITHLGDLPVARLLATAVGGPWHELHAEGLTFDAIARPLATATHDAPGDHWVIVIDNVTQERALRAQLQQQERLAAVGQLAAGVAHDFNNILAIIALQGAMAAQTPELSPRVGARLAIITEQAAHATRLIQQMLDFSRRAVLERRPLDLAALLGDQVELLAHSLPESIEVTLETGKEDYVVLADATRIQQMVMNLAVNARDAMPQGGLLRLTLVRHATPPLPSLAEGPWISLTVADSGEGISPEALAHLFEPFFTTKPPGRGTGLGLAQVYGIVKQHAGEITVHSTPGEGASITIYLPAIVEVAAAPDAPTAPLPTAPATILLVEDNPLLLEAMGDILAMLGYTVMCAGNGREALAILSDHAAAIDLVLTDLIMPQMSGDALLAAMRGRGLDIPVVVLSGHPLEGELAALQKHGLAGWLLKPPNIQELAQLLAQVLAA
jgi:two-component system cell cycle sensor histidine kinase/response regulator CckA